MVQKVISIVGGQYTEIVDAKQDALSGTGFVKSTAGTISYDTTSYVNKAGDTGVGAISMGALTATTGAFGSATAATGFPLISSGTTILGGTPFLGFFVITNTAGDTRLVLSSDTAWGAGTGSALSFAGRYRSDNPYQTTFASIAGVNSNYGDYSQRGDLVFLTNGSASVTEKARIVYNGNFLIGTATDGGYKLDVSGTARFTIAMINTPVAFASLPTGVAGMRAMINNNSAAPAFLSAANGSGSTTVPVFYNGSAWLVG